VSADVPSVMTCLPIICIESEAAVNSQSINSQATAVNTYHVFVKLKSPDEKNTKLIDTEVGKTD
jgi:hypothetical protein